MVYNLYPYERAGITLPIPRPFRARKEMPCVQGIVIKCMADGPVCRAIPVLCQRVGRIYVVAGYKLRVFNACRQRVDFNRGQPNWNKTDTFVVHKREPLTMKYTHIYKKNTYITYIYICLDLVLTHWPLFGWFPFFVLLEWVPICHDIFYSIHSIMHNIP